MNIDDKMISYLRATCGIGTQDIIDDQNAENDISTTKYDTERCTCGLSKLLNVVLSLQFEDFVCGIIRICRLNHWGLRFV